MLKTLIHMAAQIGPVTALNEVKTGRFVRVTFVALSMLNLFTTRVLCCYL